MDILITNVQAIPDKIYMIQIDDPDPGTLPDHGCTGFTIPLNLPEILISFFRCQSLAGSFQITVGDFAHVAFGIVVVIQQRALALVFLFLAFLSLLKLVQHFHIISLMAPAVQSPKP